MELKDLQDKHKDKLIFVVGAGPSLHFQDVEPLKKYVTIAVNSGIVKVPFADYFLSDDIGAKNFNYYVNLAPKLSCIKLLYREKLGKHAGCFKKEEVIWFNHKWWNDPKNKKKNPTGLVLTKDAKLPIIGARTSMRSAVHFAYIMSSSYTKIVLLGSDCCYFANKRYFWQFPGEPKVYRTTGEPVFSKPNRGMKNGRPVDSHSVQFVEYWNAFVEQNKDTPDLNIIDTSNGLLECFTKMSLPEVLQKYGVKK